MDELFDINMHVEELKTKQNKTKQKGRKNNSPSTNSRF
jgi:hypothetical protein